MSNLVSSFIKNCFSSNAYRPIIAQSKKDDDLGKDAISKWASAYRSNEDIANWETIEINEFVTKLFQALPVTQICTANQQEVKEHLLNVARRCERAQRAVFREWRKAKLDDSEFKNDVGASLALTTSKFF